MKTITSKQVRDWVEKIQLEAIEKVKTLPIDLTKLTSSQLVQLISDNAKRAAAYKISGEDFNKLVDEHCRLVDEYCNRIDRKRKLF